jgi:WXXGXW repeat (2 copies)
VFITRSARNGDLPARDCVEDVMKRGFILAALAVSASALAGAPIALHSEVAQAQIPAYPPTPPALVAPAPPPGPEAEIPPPAPSPSYVWEPGHWSWNGVQYLWQPGRYVERPAVSATYVPGHWEQQANGWVWVEGRWDYPGVGSSTPPAWYPSAR